jgi:hypothetical protein
MSEFKIGAATVRSVWEMNDSSFQLRQFFPLSSDGAIADVERSLCGLY